MAKLFESPHYIAVEGPIRVGKSTLSSILAERMHAQRLAEPEDNAFLRAFYDGERGAAFQAQFAFLVRRYEQLKALDVGPASRNVVIADYIFEKDKIFACLNLTDPELEIYNRYYNLFREQVPTPDLVIYLQAAPEYLAERVRRRAVEFERGISTDYLAVLAEQYGRFFYQYNASPVLIVNTERLNFADNDRDLNLLIERLAGMRGGREFFNFGD